MVGTISESPKKDKISPIVLDEGIPVPLVGTSHFEDIKWVKNVSPRSLDTEDYPQDKMLKFVRDNNITRPEIPNK